MRIVRLLEVLWVAPEWSCASDRLSWVVASRLVWTLTMSGSVLVLRLLELILLVVPFRLVVVWSLKVLLIRLLVLKLLFLPGLASVLVIWMWLYSLVRVLERANWPA